MSIWISQNDIVFDKVRVFNPMQVIFQGDALDSFLVIAAEGGGGTHINQMGVPCA
jgi:hypothetical protein